MASSSDARAEELDGGEVRRSPPSSKKSLQKRLMVARMGPVESEMSSCPMEANECDDAESIVIASSTISDVFSTTASSRNIPFYLPPGPRNVMRQQNNDAENKEKGKTIQMCSLCH